MPTDPVAEQGVLTFLMDPGIPGSKSVQLSGVGLRYGVLREGFEGEQFPPLGWIVIDANNDGKGWLRNVGFAPPARQRLIPGSPVLHLTSMPAHQGSWATMIGSSHRE